MQRMPSPRRLLAPIAAALLLVGCGGEGDRSASPSPIVSATATAPATPTAVPTPTPSPTPLPLSLEPPPVESDAVVEFQVVPRVPAEGAGQLVVMVTNRGEAPITEIVLRWPTALGEKLLLTPFQPSSERIGEGATLVQPWTRWVVGPGSQGEPEGTTSLGWGPIDPAMTLEIPIVATRRAAGPVEFDLQLLDNDALLRSADGGPAQTRVQIPP